jgi:integrase/recombinase XerD
MPRKHRPIKRLIDIYEPGKGKAQTINSPSHLSDILWRASKGDLGKRNVAITMMLFGSGLRINEVAQLTVRDVFRSNGELKKTFIVPAKYTKTNKSRIAYIVVPQQRQALETWRKQRLSDNGMLADDRVYGGLRGDSPLFFSKKSGWRKFALNSKKYKVIIDDKKVIKETLVCNSLENLMKDILKGAGIQGGFSHSGRRSLSTWLDRKGCSLELIQYVLNHEDPEMSIEYIDT